MTHTYNISGMTCSACVSKVKSQLLMLGDITDANVQHASPQATITMQKHIPLDVLQAALNKAGGYVISEVDSEMDKAEHVETTASWLTTYKPLILVGAYITGITVFIEAADGSFDVEIWMQYFMAAFFLAFSFFKMLDLRGFAESYFTYDIIAKRWMTWGYIYAFIELGLGIAYLLKFNPLLTNAVTFIVMNISIMGVLQSVINKRKIRCACLGTVFSLPMSTITIIEDALMIGMSGVTLAALIS
jgi:cation transport ATPase